MKLNATRLDQALHLLASHLELADAPLAHLVICGGASLMATGVVSRTTKDVDIVAMRAEDGSLHAPVPMPGFLLDAAAVVARDLGLDANWLNNGPSQAEGGLFQMGLPEGLAGRLTEREYGMRLKISFIGRLDQIFFKVYSAADRGGVDLNDLAALTPSAGELEAAARWATGIDVSEGYRMQLHTLLKDLGHETVAERI